MTNQQLNETISINPTTWSQAFRYDQAQLRPAPAQILSVSGQGPIAADMNLRDVLRMTIYVTDIDAALAAYGAITERLDAVGATPPATLVEVSRLAVPGMSVEIDVTAGR